MAVDYRGAIDEGVQAAKLVHNALYDLLANQLGVPSFIAQAVAAVATVPIAVGRAAYILVLFVFVSAGTTLITAVLQVIKQIRQDGAADFAKVTGEAVGEFMAIDTKDVDFATGKAPAQVLARAKQIGDLVLTMLQSQFGTKGPQTPEQGEAAAKALAGYGVNFATSNVFLSWLVELGTEGHLGDFDKLGEDIAQTLGLGRLTRRAIQPLIRNAISHPYDRKMRALYRADILSAGELVKAALSGRMEEDTARDLIAQHGFSEELISELFAQHTPSLHESEIELLEALGRLGLDFGAGQLKAQGVPDSIAQWRLQVQQWKRLNHVREAILGDVLGQIHKGFLPATALDDWCIKLGIPADEAQLWRQRAGALLELPSKRLSHADMLFLFEGGQVTLSEVQEWAAAEGYSPDDQTRLLLLFELKATAAVKTKSGGAAVKAGHIHKEHVAFVTDQITGLWGRAPEKAELDYWVNLLDLGERTKADFKTELKALDTTGPAIPPTPPATQ